MEETMKPPQAGTYSRHRGIRAINAMGLKPDLYHSNEGHSAFISLERLRSY